MPATPLVTMESEGVTLLLGRDAAALEAAETGKRVVLVEKRPYVGGRVSQLYKYFPKLCFPTCGLEINQRRSRMNPNLTILTMAEVTGLKGEKGNYTATVKLSPRYVNDNCTACGALDGWLLRADIRQAFAPAYHFSMVFGDDMVPAERDRWRATYSPKGAPSWVVLAADGSYLCTATGGFTNATTALELHKLLSRATSRPGEASKLVEGPVKPRPCNASTMGSLGL